MRMWLPFPSPASLFPSSVVPRPTYNGGVDRALNLLLYPSNLASPGRLVKIARSLSPLFSRTHVVGIDQGGLPTDEAVAPTVRLTRIRGASLGAPLGGPRVVVAWGARVYRRFARQRVAAVSAQNLFLLPLAHALARRTGAVFAYNAHELETETVGSAGLRQRLQRVIERRYIRRADVVSVVNESIAQWYREAYPGVDPVVVTNAPTGADGVIDLRAQLGIPEGALLYLHSGYLAPGRNIPLILRAFEQVTSAHVVFVGAGALLPEVERAAAQHTNIHRLPPVEPDQVLAMTRGADVALCLIESGCLSHRMSTPNKMMEAFAAGVPALCSPLSEARRYLGDQADTWVLEDPERDLIGALESITREDIGAFTAPTIPTWEEGAARLREAYERALAARARP
ncbi:glycosyltransferase [Pauljensenia sp. UMB0018B]|uniref:Glycosyl transferase family 1 n=1 Tax=Schaalia odontolytica TaxID=1660 RepID=A0A2I1HYQ7_9ACTO|nr:glycosyltransferase [Schaalia odontolytica]MDK7339659.1 glycosyltransferase [Pauljensenia sp. UMB0018B]PKY64022.1 glycosyl transferase family 1 [Schaalia odontolytica]